MATSEAIHQKVLAELSGVSDVECAHAIRQLLVAPRCEQREWDYGPAGQTHPCWIVLEHRATDTCIAYCERGFGPSCPWGLLFIEGPWLNMGMDYQWYTYLEDAFRQSQAWSGENPEGYEVR